MRYTVRPYARPELNRCTNSTATIYICVWVRVRACMLICAHVIFCTLRDPIEGEDEIDGEAVCEAGAESLHKQHSHNPHGVPRHQQHQRDVRGSDANNSRGKGQNNQ